MFVTSIYDPANRSSTIMPDILYLLTAIGFFALMIVFIWACEKV